MNRVTRRIGKVLLGAGLAALCAGVSAGPARAQWIVKSEDGKASIKLGLLAQGRSEWGKIENIDAVSQNLYVRRARIILGGEVHPRVSFFLDTDSPGLGGIPPQDSVKSYGGQYVQDLVVTAAVIDGIRLDGGLILVPTSYNHLQSAATHLALDYGPYTFVENDPMQEKVGRDAGLQARGVIAGKLVEYRLGVFQGVRGRENVNPLRATGRVSLHPFKTASNNFFYTGNGFGKTKVLCLGAAADVQKDYRSIHGDLYAEIPLAEGSCLTLQTDVSSYDGGDLLPDLPKQTTYLAEIGFALLKNRLSFWAQAAMRDYDSETRSDETNLQFGVGGYLDGHRSAVKLAVDRRSYDAPKDGTAGPSRTVVALQYQIFYF
jgi:hypothetical protein